MRAESVGERAISGGDCTSWIEGSAEADTGGVRGGVSGAIGAGRCVVLMVASWRRGCSGRDRGTIGRSCSGKGRDLDDSGGVRRKVCGWFGGRLVEIGAGRVEIGVLKTSSMLRPISDAISTSESGLIITFVSAPLKELKPDPAADLGVTRGDGGSVDQTILLGLPCGMCGEPVEGDLEMDGVRLVGLYRW